MDCELFVGKKVNNELLYVYDQKMIYKKKSKYKDVFKYECWLKSCKARVMLMPDGKCLLAKKYVEHNHDHQEKEFKEMCVLNKIKSDCVNVAGTICGGQNAVSSIRMAFENNCESYVL